MDALHQARRFCSIRGGSCRLLLAEPFYTIHCCYWYHQVRVCFLNVGCGEETLHQIYAVLCSMYSIVQYWTWLFFGRKPNVNSALRSLHWLLITRRCWMSIRWMAHIAPRCFWCLWLPLLFVQQRGAHQLIIWLRLSNGKKKMLLISCLSELHSGEEEDCSIMSLVFSSFSPHLCAQDVHDILFTEQWGCTVRFSEKKTHGGIRLKDCTLVIFLFFFLFVFFGGKGSQKLLGDLRPWPTHAHPLLSCSPFSVGLGKWTRSAMEGRQEKAAELKAFSPTFRLIRKELKSIIAVLLRGEKKTSRKIIPPPINFISICHRLVRLCW